MIPEVADTLEVQDSMALSSGSSVWSAPKIHSMAGIRILESGACSLAGGIRRRRFRVTDADDDADVGLVVLSSGSIMFRDGNPQLNIR